MIEINPRYGVLFETENIDQDCDRIAGMMSDQGKTIKEAMDAGLYNQGIIMYLQLLKSMNMHFVEDELWCYFDDMYSPEYSMQSIYNEIMMHNLDTEAVKLLKDGHEEIKQTEAYNEYGIPLYIYRLKE